MTNMNVFNRIGGIVRSTAAAITGGSISGISVGTDASTIGALPVWHKFTVAHTDLQAAALTNSITLFTLPAGGIIHAVKIKQSTAFAGGLIATYTLSLGIVGSLLKYTAAFDAFQAVSATALQLSTTVGQESHTAGVAIKLTAVSTVANLSATTAGAADIWVLLSKAV